MAGAAKLKYVKIHPAIGIARVGNSDEFYIGPEELDKPPSPHFSTGTADGFKETDERVRKQAARFRVYAYYDDGSCEEVTARDARIEWTVHVANKKAVTRNGGITDEKRKVIDPGLKRVYNEPGGTSKADLIGKISLGANADESRDVPLGRIEVDNEGRLLVLGGNGFAGSFDSQGIIRTFDNPKWYDDTSDGPVTVEVTFSGQTDVKRSTAWVVVGPPKFSPDFDNSVSLYDRLFQNTRDKHPNRVIVPTKPNYKRDILPVLNRARGVRWTVQEASGHHLWGDNIPLQKAKAIFARLKKPSGDGGGDMPAQAGNVTLTKTQYEMFEKWQKGDFDPSEPPRLPVPEELDRAALTACVGAAFSPGIEVGGMDVQRIDDTGNFLADDWIRLDHTKVKPGEITEHMAVPWHSDFAACRHTWWPIHRPNQVIRGDSGYQAWDKDADNADKMVATWAKLGFVLKKDGQWVEKGRGKISTVLLRSMHLDFGTVAPASAGMPAVIARDVLFDVRTGGRAVTLRVDAADRPTHDRLMVPTNSMTVAPREGDEVVQVRIPVLYETGAAGERIQDKVTVCDADTGERWTVTITARTSEVSRTATGLVLAGAPSTSAAVVSAASVFVDLLRETSEVGLVRAASDGRSEVLTLAVGDERADGEQLIASVVERGGPAPELVKRAERWLADAGSQYDDQVIVAVTGDGPSVRRPGPSTGDGGGGGWADLHKQFLQVLGEIRNTGVVLHTDDVLVPDHEHAVPLQLTELDATVEVLLLTADPSAIDFRLQSPDGVLVGPERAAAGVTWLTTGSLVRYRVSLPVELVAGRPEGAGTWKAVLRSGAGDGPVPYVLAAHTSSPVSLKVDLDRTEVEQGTDVTLRAGFTASSLLSDVHVRAEVTQPDGNEGLLSLRAQDIGGHVLMFATSAEGTYRIRVRGQGRTPQGRFLEREHTVNVTAGARRDGAWRFTDVPAARAPVTVTS